MRERAGQGCSRVSWPLPGSKQERSLAPSPAPGRGASQQDRRFHAWEAQPLVRSSKAFASPAIGRKLVPDLVPFVPRMAKPLRAALPLGMGTELTRAVPQLHPGASGGAGIPLQPFLCLLPPPHSTPDATPDAS